MTPPVDWPEDPYPGLSSYQASEAFLFTGREADVEACAAVLAPADTRVVMLHGRTGCGKSSFLLAGLLPSLKTSDRPFSVIRSESGDSATAMFVRSTEAPLAQLASRLFEFSGQTVPTRIRGGVRTVDLRDLRDGYTDPAKFIDALTTTTLVDRLETLSARLLPTTLILVIDQAEEVLTQNEETTPFREEFFDFLARFIDRKTRLKLVLSLRTEYFGEFFSAIDEKLPDPPGIRSFFLKDFSVEQIERAITFPTREDTNIQPEEPGKHYHFSWEPGLARLIAEDISDKAGASWLPVMQIVCSRLYRDTKKATAWEIKRTDYEKVGGVEGQIEAYIQQALESYCRKTVKWTGSVPKETRRWRKVLHKLTIPMTDGTVTTRIMPLKDLSQAAAREGCAQPEETLREMAAEKGKNRLLRTTETEKERVEALSLAHDVIGLVLDRWYTRDKVNHRALITFRLLGTMMLAAVVIWLAIYREKPPDWVVVLGGYGVLFLVMGFAPPWGVRMFGAKGPLGYLFRLFGVVEQPEGRRSTKS